MQTVWNLQPLYKSTKDNNFEKDITEGKEKVLSFINKWKTNKQYLKEPKILKQALDEYEQLNTHYGILNKPTYYIWLKRATDQNNTELKAIENKLNDICIELENNIQFFELNISKIPKSRQKKFLNSKYLKDYKHYLEHLFNISKYILSDKEERIFNIKSKTSISNWIDMLEELLSKQTLEVIDESGNKIKIPYNQANKYLSSLDDNVRDYCAKEVLKINQRYLEIAEYEINSVLEDKKVNDQYRKLPRPDILRHLSDDIETNTVDTLIKVITDNFDIPIRFYKLKAKILGKKKLKYYDRYIELSNSSKEYSLDESFNIVKNVFKNLDTSFEDILNKYISEGHYDIYPKESKSGGAFCISISKSLPTYILLNHNNKLQDITTIAHETGHGIHSELSNKQNSLNSGHSTATAEVASTFFEDFVLDEVIKDLNKEEKKYIKFKRLEEEISTIFRQIACYNFETELHKQYRELGYLSSIKVSEIFTQEISKYMGEIVEIDDHMKTGWIYWSHIRRFFYVYSYASGLLISKSLQNLVKEDPNNISLIKNFMQCGTSKSTSEIFMDIGIDISSEDFWLRGIQEIRSLLEELEKEF